MDETVPFLGSEALATKGVWAGSSAVGAGWGHGANSFTAGAFGRVW